MRNPIIQALPTDEAVKKLIDEVVPPELPDRQKKEFARFLLTIANPDNDDQWRLANVAAHHLYENTFEYESGFDNFVGFPAYKAYSSTEHYQSVEQEQ
jgi:hypothetical protein